jgi:hypothetical protein
MALKKVVAVHAGGSTAYQYVSASLFVVHQRGDGTHIWRNSGISTLPRRSVRLARRDARELAEAHGTVVMEDFGSMQNQRVRPITLDHDDDLADIIRVGLESGEYPTA